MPMSAYELGFLVLAAVRIEKNNYTVLSWTSALSSGVFVCLVVVIFVMVLLLLWSPVAQDVAENHLELLILLPLPPKRRNYEGPRPNPVSVVLGIKPKAFCSLGMDSTS